MNQASLLAFENNNFDSKREEIYYYIQLHPGCTSHDIERDLKIEKNKFSGRLGEMFYAGIISRELDYGKGCNRHYCIRSFNEFKERNSKVMKAKEIMGLYKIKRNQNATSI